MATVPGVPDRTIPNIFAPTRADMLIAAFMHQQGRFQTAMDTSGMRPSTNIEDIRQSPGDYTEEDPRWKRYLATKAYATQPRKPLPELRGEMPRSQVDIDKDK